MENLPLISIIVPVFNGEEHLAHCLDSIREQTYSNFEVIIVDDGSTDSTPTLLALASKHDPRFRVISISNQGQAIARNRGLDEARGEFIAMVDADDAIAPCFLETMYALLCHSGCDIAVCGYSRSWRRVGLNNEHYHVKTPRSHVADVLYQRRSHCSVWARLYRRSMWDGVRFEKMFFEDLEVFPRVTLKASGVVTTTAPLYYYRNRECSFMNTFTPGRLDALRAIDKVVDTVDATGDRLIMRAARARRLSALYNTYLILERHPEYADTRQRCYREIKSMRRDCILDPSTRLRNKIASLLSYLGPGVLATLNRLARVSH